MNYWRKKSKTSIFIFFKKSSKIEELAARGYLGLEPFKVGAPIVSREGNKGSPRITHAV
jgi:hypothetical protein